MASTLELKLKIRVLFARKTIIAEIDRESAANVLRHHLPFEANVHLWGDEIYFPAPFKMSLGEDATDVVDKGTICFWVEGSSIAIPFGPTPISRGDECRLVAPVNILGRLDSNPNELSDIEEGERVRIELA